MDDAHLSIAQADEIYSYIAKRGWKGVGTRLAAADKIKDPIKADEAYIAIAQEERYNASNSFAAANRIKDREKAEPVYISISQDWYYEGRVRLESAENINDPTLMKRALLSIAFDYNVSEDARSTAESYFDNVGIDQADILAVASNEELDARTRVNAAQMLEDTQKADELFLSIAAGCGDFSARIEALANVSADRRNDIIRIGTVLQNKTYTGESGDISSILEAAMVVKP